MTGRRLYELLCDGWATNARWLRASEHNQLGLSADPVAWPFLGCAEKRMFNDAARRLKGVRR